MLNQSVKYEDVNWWTIWTIETRNTEMRFRVKSVVWAWVFPLTHYSSKGRNEAERRKIYLCRRSKGLIRRSNKPRGNDGNSTNFWWLRKHAWGLIEDRQSTISSIMGIVTTASYHDSANISHQLLSRFVLKGYMSFCLE